MKKLIIAATAVLLISTITSQAQSPDSDCTVVKGEKYCKTLKVEVVAPAGFEITKVNRAPSAGYVNWCVKQMGGKMQADPETCNAEGKQCKGMCVGDDGQRIVENWKNAAQK